MAHRDDITNTILEACKAVAPQVNWGFSLTGARKSNLIEGTVTCNEVNYNWISKDEQHGTAQYDIVIIELDGDINIDTMADDLFSCFNATNMGGLCYSVNITRVVFGAVANISTSKVVKIEMDVEYPIDL